MKDRAKVCWSIAPLTQFDLWTYSTALGLIVLALVLTILALGMIIPMEVALIDTDSASICTNIQELVLMVLSKVQC